MKQTKEGFDVCLEMPKTVTLNSQLLLQIDHGRLLPEGEMRSLERLGVLGGCIAALKVMETE